MLTSKDIHVFALLYGDYHHLHSRLICSLQSALPADVPMDFWCNQVCKDTYEFMTKVRRNNWKMTYSDANVPKYKAMHTMFDFIRSGQDEAKWVIWFDDDSWINSKDWLDRVLALIESRKSENPVYIGQKWYVHHLAGQWDFIKSRPWFKGKEPEIIKGRPGISFATGGYWWLRSDLLRQLDWPDPELSHNGGDTLLGEAVRQQGFKLIHYDYGVKVNDAKRRGRHEAPAGCSDKNARR